MAVPAVNKEKKYTYDDYREWVDDTRWEIINGRVYSMSPAPIISHQRIVGNFFFVLKNRIDKTCPVFSAPTDVVLDEQNIVQPDVFAVCDPGKISEKNIQGAPDLIVEVTSPGTFLLDKREKKELYQRFGVKEYLIASPEYESVERFVLKEGVYGPADVFNWDEPLSLKSFEEILDLREIFEKKPGKTESAG